MTSAIGLYCPRAEQLWAVGLDHLQVSIQADDPAEEVSADRVELAPTTTAATRIPASAAGPPDS
ncbi:MAG TPA: hypothetical protein VH228_18150 [Nocardioides sp.]|nr:hypothetical protein [Nocardioides sp.]